MRAFTLLPSGFLVLGGYNLVLPALAQIPPACSPYVFSYNDAADLAAQTNIVFSAMSLCSGVSSSAAELAGPTTTTDLAAIISSTSSEAAATSSASAPNPFCIYGSDPSQLKNAGFECADINNYGWASNAVFPYSDPLFAHGGSSTAGMNPFGAPASLQQLITLPNQNPVLVTFWIRLLAGDEDLNSCQLLGTVNPSAQGTDFRTIYSGLTGVAPITAGWTQVSFQGLGGGSIYNLQIQWTGCVAGTSLYVDDVTVSTFVPPDLSCTYSTDPSKLKNNGFECTDLSNFGWAVLDANPFYAPTFAHGGSYVLSMSSTAAGNTLQQSIAVQSGDTMTVTFWVRLMVGDENLDGCQLLGTSDDGTQAPQPQTLYSNIIGTAPTSAGWTLVTFNFVVGGNVDLFTITWVGCTHSTKLYFDDFSLAVVSAPP